MVINASAQDIPNKVSLTEEEQAWIAEHPTITASNSTSYAPFDFTTAGEPTGLSTDYLKLLTSKVGLKVEHINHGSWSENLKMGMEQKLDVLQTLSKTEKRQEFFAFSDSYFIDNLVLYGRVGSERINNIADLKDKRIGIIKGHFITESYQAHFPDLNYVVVDNIRDALKALISNDIDVYPHENVPIRFSITQNNTQGLEIIGDEFIIENSKIDQRIAVHKNNPILMSIINKSIAAVTDEEFEAIYDKWIKSDQTINDIDLTEEERAWLTENSTINVSIDATQAPLEFLESNGRISGQTGAYLDIISNKLGINFKWARNSNFAEGLEKIKSKEVDLITLLAPTEERKEFLTFTDPYAEVSQMIFAPTSKIYASLDALEDKTISQVRGYSITERIIQDFPKINIVFASSVEEALDLVETGKADAFVGSLPITSYQISKNGYDDLIVVGDTPYRGANAFGIRSDLHLLASAMQKAMQSITPDIKAEISTNWLGYKPTPKVNYGPLYYVIGLTFFIIFISFLWVNGLKKEVKLRKASEERYKTLVNSTPFCIHEIDLDGSIISINQAGLKMMGVSSEINIIGKKYCSIPKKAGDQDRISKLLIAAFNGNGSSFEFDIETEGGSFQFYSMFIPLKDEEGNVYKVIGITEDKTETNRVVKSLNDQKFALDQHAIVAITDIEGTITFVNDLFCEISGYGQDELLGQNHRMINSGTHETAFWKEMFLTISRGNVWHGEVCNKAKGGGEYWLETTVVPFTETKGKPTSYISIRTDITKRKIMELSLKKATKVAQDANQAKSVFLTNMSHDLRTPLNAIIGFSETIKEEIFGPVSNKKYLEYNQDIHASGKYLLKLVNDILDISALEANKKELEYETIDMSLLVSDCLSVVHKIAKDKNIAPTTNILNDASALQADKQALKRILLNLLSNAIKFTPTNGNVTISSNVSDGNYIFQVSDTGCGISEGDINIITQPFTRAESSAFVRDEEGTGLGLSIVKSLVGLHGGELIIKSKIGEGTTVTVELPLIAANNQIEGSY